MVKRPQVVIIGRKNVGKSTLFNRCSDEVKSITLNYEGVTRDFLSDIVCWRDVCFDLIDSGGLSFQKTEDSMQQQIDTMVMQLIDNADLILLMVDGAIGMLPEDRLIARLIQKKGKDSCLVINKSDDKRFYEHRYEFDRLGIRTVYPISAQHGLGINDLLDAVVNIIKKGEYTDVIYQPKYRIVLLGKPNVGKSSLMNTLLKQERALVTDIPGTTREAITEKIMFNKQVIAMTDTPGIRRKRSVSDSLEEMMIKSSFRAIDVSDIVLLMIDGVAGRLSDQEKKLAFYTFEHYKALILLVNKEDLMDNEDRISLEEDFQQYHFFIRKIPILYISCLTGKNVGKILPVVEKIWEKCNQQFSEEELSYLFKEALTRKPLFHAGDRLYLYRAKQVKVTPITIIIYVNQPMWFGESQRAYLENILRDNFDLRGIPIRIIPRKK